MGTYSSRKINHGLGCKCLNIKQNTCLTPTKFSELICNSKMLLPSKKQMSHTITAIMKNINRNVIQIYNFLLLPTKKKKKYLAILHLITNSIKQIIFNFSLYSRKKSILKWIDSELPFSSYALDIRITRRSSKRSP